MSCKKPCNKEPNKCTCGINNGIFIIVLFILLAIILGSAIFY